ncbi:MAG: 50S ribosomal protein L11 methyltransferase [Balneolaceae bacterium]|nr:MAG: 50S ribosomal protein L11 methyltransferase [Balneolaceae bacterium]
MKYLKFNFTIPEHLQEYFIAELMDLDFYGFEQFDERMEAYVEQRRYNDSHREFIEQLVSIFPDVSFSEEEEIEEQNWNQTWEQSIQPQRIGRFLVKPTWSSEVASDDQILLEIDPKMSFGTGYHPTTRLILRELGKMPLKGKKVMDAGTGTGILAIAAIKLGAAYAIGFDTDPWSKDNAFENTLINDVQDRIVIRFGGIEQVSPEDLFDISLANINRNVILEIIPFLVAHTNIGGQICISGLLYSDEDIIRAKLSDQPVNILNVEREEEWILFRFEKIDTISGLS